MFRFFRCSVCVDDHYVTERETAGRCVLMFVALRALLDVARCCWMLLDVAGCCWMLLDVAGRCWMLLDVAGCCWMLLDVADFRGVAGRCWTLPSVAGCCWTLYTKLWLPVMLTMVELRLWSSLLQHRWLLWA